MTFDVEYAAAAARQIRKLDPGMRMRIGTAIDRLRVQPEIGKPLKKEPAH